jgi:hypothetical protein
MQISQRPLRLISRASAIFALATAAALSLQAQSGGGSGSKGVSTSFAQPVFSSASLIAASDAPDAIGYSSSAGAAETESAVSYMSSSLAASPNSNPGPQPPPRRYGRRPVYADSHHNADGSNKYTFFGGGGFTNPTGGTHNYLATGYDLQVGGGRNFNKKVALLAQFDYNHFGIQTNTLNSLLGIYSNLCGDDCTGTAISQIGGTNHIWSFTLDPMYTYLDGDKFGGYVIGGVGFYHKVTDFTTPATGEYCDIYYGCIEYEANETIDSYVSNAAGVNGGLGFTYKASRFSDLKFYAEARYVYTANSPRPYYDGSTGTNPSANPNYFDVFPQNAAKTTYIPIIFGVRF